MVAVARFRFSMVAHRWYPALVGVVVLVVGKADRIEDQVVVNMSLVNMGGKYKLVLATRYFFFRAAS